MKKTNFALKNMVTLIYIRKKHTLWQKFLLHFRTPKGIKKKKKMPFGVPAHTYMEELLDFFSEMKDIAQLNITIRIT